MAYTIKLDTTALTPLFEADKPKNGGFQALSGGKRLAPDDVPTSAVQEDRRALPQAFLLWGTWCIRQDIKDVIERVEPSVHQFFPIALKNKAGVPYETAYYLLNICNLFLALIVENPDKEMWMHQRRLDASGEWVQGEPLMSGVPEHGFAVSRPKVAGRHLWRSHHISTSKFFCSDTLADALRAIGEPYAKHGYNWEITYITLTPCSETDEMWEAEKHAPRLMKYFRDNPELARELPE